VKKFIHFNRFCSTLPVRLFPPALHARMPSAWIIPHMLAERIPKSFMGIFPWRGRRFDGAIEGSHAWIMQTRRRNRVEVEHADLQVAGRHLPVDFTGKP